MTIPPRSPMLDAMLEADLDRMLAIRRSRRPFLSAAAYKGWRTRREMGR